MSRDVWHHDHTAAEMLLAEAQRVARMSKAQRNAYREKVVAERGKKAANDLAVVLRYVLRKDGGDAERP